MSQRNFYPSLCSDGAAAEYREAAAILCMGPQQGCGIYCCICMLCSAVEGMLCALGAPQHTPMQPLPVSSFCG